ncbi:MbcA/ParS/Xre antitoxin family protein [Pseudomonas paeninsulae]|uniref:MbcA/ParS/Xre antitoxin family protein n=1 Tax=Pseudomonas paeninsulae TaxID=3110772 RepID=UPI002D77937E|nr:MbcA/ParS/Xre antitoxin family protein [Pseudomonas sp. IT1137]
MDKPAEDRSVTALKGLIKKPETPVSVDLMNPISATTPVCLTQVVVLAEEVFEDKAIATSWMTTANKGLGGKTPISLCETEIGAHQVLRVLRAIEWGGVA